MITLEVITFARGEEVERRLIGAFTSRRAAKRAALGSHHRECIRAWPSHLSTVALGEAHVGGRPHRWLSDELEEAERAQETVADRIDTHGFFAF